MPNRKKTLDASVAGGTPASEFNPTLLWAPQFLIGIACIWLAFDIWSMAGRPDQISDFVGSLGHLIAGALSVLIVWLGVSNLRRALIRRNGIVIERNAQRRLQRHLPAGWKMEISVPWYGGDIDILLTAPGGARGALNITPPQFAIEIKALRSLKWNPYLPAKRKGWFGASITAGSGIGNFSTRRGQPLKRDIGRQAKAAADVFKAKPILWLPLGKGETFAADDVIVVLGSPKRLLLAVSAI